MPEIRRAFKSLFTLREKSTHISAEPPRIKELQFFPSKISLTSGREFMSDSNLPNPPPDDSPTALKMSQDNGDPSTPSSTPQINGNSSTIVMPPEPGSDGSATLRMAQLDDTPSRKPSNGLRFSSPPPPEADGFSSPHQLSSQPGTPTSEAGGVPWSAAVGRASLGKSGRVIDRLMGDNDRLRRDKTLATAKLEEELKKSESAKSTLEALQSSNANLQSMHDIDKAALNRKDRKLEEMRAELDAERSRREKAEAEVKITRQEREEAVEKYKKEAMKGQEEARYASTQYDVLSKSYKSMEQVYQRHTQKLRADLKSLQDSTANDHKKLSNLELISEQLRQEGHKSQKSKDRICNELEAFKAEQTKTLSGIKERAKRNDITNEEVLKEVETVLGQMRYVVNVKNDVKNAE